MVMGTAAITALADAFMRARRRQALLVAVLVAGMAACGPGVRTYTLGEGAADIVGYQLAYLDGGGAEEIGQPTTEVAPWSFGCRQFFAGGRSGTAVLLQQPCGDNQQVFALTGDFWHLYRAAGEKAPAIYGFPLGRRGEWQGGWTQGFGRRGSFHAMFMQRPGRAPFVLSAPVLGYYLSFDDRHVRFGYPTAERVTMADGRRCQAFEQGAIVVTGDDERMTFEKTPSGCQPDS